MCVVLELVEDERTLPGEMRVQGTKCRKVQQVVGAVPGVFAWNGSNAHKECTTCRSTNSLRASMQVMVLQMSRVLNVRLSLRSMDRARSLHGLRVRVDFV